MKYNLYTKLNYKVYSLYCLYKLIIVYKLVKLISRIKNLNIYLCLLAFGILLYLLAFQSNS